MQFSPTGLLIGMAVIMLIFGLPAIFRPHNFDVVVRKTLKNTEAIRLLGFIMLIISYLFLTTYWRFDNTRNLLISILGWISLLKGIVAIRFPGYSMKKYETMIGFSKIGIVSVGIICTVLGILLGYRGIVKF